MKTKEILIAARAKIERPETWTQGTFSRNSRGEDISSPKSKNAVCWCSLGAIIAEAPSYDDELYAAKILSLVINNHSIAQFNDSSTHTEVLAAFDRAISLVD